ncbi:MAG: UvrD-helicase domain-containing protein [Coriobacteriia bacterium]|nr:UvrD-helicase domain-containing protein [Coriobacteriia bacterium]
MELSDERFTPSQQDCIRHLDSLLISAGAGSGKTFTLTNRIAYALCTEDRPEITSINQILAITFTEKAASEIKSRVRSVLREQGLIDQARLVDGAWISTIHGLSQRILRIHALELGLDPGFTVLDNPQQQQFLEDAFNTVLRTGDEAARLYERLAEEYRGKDAPWGMISGIIHEAASVSGGLAAIHLGPKPEEPSTLARELLCAYEALIAIAPRKTTSQKAALENRQRLIQTLVAFIQGGSNTWKDLERLLQDMERPRVQGESAACSLAVQVAIDKAYQELNLANTLEYSKALLQLAKEVQQTYKSLKQKQNCIDISESVALALEALKKHPQIAQRYQEQFKLVMVDEFQDTNQLQVDFITCLTHDDKSNLCTVGDAQQSIYRFQGADVQVYRKHKEDMRSSSVNARSIQLERNFRSHEDVLSFVRTVCGQEGYFPEDFLDLKAARKGSDYKGKTPRIDVSMTTYEKRKTDAVITAEAQAIARRFDELRQDGHSEGEMVLLLGNTLKARVYAQALRDAGFSTIVAGGSGFYQAPEVQLLGQLLHALANPENTEALYAVLTSELFTLSDDDLLEIATIIDKETGLEKRANYGARMSGDSIEGASSRVLFAQELLKDAWTAVGASRPSDILLGVLVDSGWLLRLKGMGIEGQAVSGNLLKSLRTVEDIQAEHGFDIAQTAQRFARLAGDKEKPGVLATSEHNAVRIMTIHAAKGLEFPLVAVAECYDVRGKEESLLIVKDGERIHLSLKPGESEAECPVVKDYRYNAPEGLSMDTAGSLAEFRSALLQGQRENELAERKRVLYVALTRAREALFVSMRAKADKKGLLPAPLQEVIAEALFADGEFPYADELVEYGGSEALRYHFQATDSDSSVLDEDGSEVEQTERAILQRQRYILELRPKEGLKLSIPDRQTGLVSYSSLVAGYKARSNSDAAELIADTDKATDFGSAFHRLAQLGYLLSPERALDKLESIARAGGVTDVARLRRAAENWFSSSVYRQTLAFADPAPEVAFCVPYEGVFLEGAIDLLCMDRENARAFVVDYKTGGSPDETPEELHNRHLLQAQCYAYSLLNSGFEQVDLVFARVEQLDGLGDIQRVAYSFTDLGGGFLPGI